MTEPSDPAAGGGPTPKGSAPAPGYGTSGNAPATPPATAPASAAAAAPASTSAPESGSPAPTPATPEVAEGTDDTATTQFPAATAHRAEGTVGGVSKAYSGGAAGRAAPIVSPAERRGPLESVLVLRRIDPWSAFTTVLGLMFALYLVWMVAIGVTYLLLSGMGVWDRLGGLLSGVAGDESASVIGPSTIFLYSGGVGLLNVLLLSILCTLAVFIYNLAAGLTGGGVQVTLSDRRN